MSWKCENFKTRGSLFLSLPLFCISSEEKEARAGEADRSLLSSSSLCGSFVTSRLALRAMASTAAASWSKRGAAASSPSATAAATTSAISIMPPPLLRPFFPSSARTGFSSRAAMLRASSSSLSSMQITAALRSSSRAFSPASALRHPRPICGVAAAASASSSTSDADPLPPLSARPSRVPQPGKPYVITTPLYYVSLFGGIEEKEERIERYFRFLLEER